MPKLSVIVPVYRAEEYLEKCVWSILNQVWRDLELILVDDGSPDQCPQLCDELAATDSRVRVIHQPNAGVAAARNAGLDAATGEYITFVDSDDYIDPDMYITMLEKAEEKDCDVVLCDCLKEFPNYTEVYDHDIRPGLYTPKQLKEEYWPHLLIMENIEYPATISNCTMVFRQSCASRYLAGIRYSEDWLFGAQVMLHARSFFYLKGNAFYHYVMNPGSATHQHVPDKWKDYLRLYQGMEDTFRTYPNYDFNHQVDLALLFLIYNAVGSVFGAKGESHQTKYQSIREILDEPVVRTMFERIRVFKLPITQKQRMITWCYQHRIGLNLLIRYYQ